MNIFSLLIYIYIFFLQICGISSWEITPTQNYENNWYKESNPILAYPTIEPSSEPNSITAINPTIEPSPVHLADSNLEPSMNPTVEPTTSNSSLEPTLEPSGNPSIEPTLEPSSNPTIGRKALSALKKFHDALSGWGSNSGVRTGTGSGSGVAYGLGSSVSYGYGYGSDTSNAQSFYGWNFNDSNADPCSQWSGLVCGESGITSIDLTGFHLIGTIALELGDLSVLQSLILNDNSIGGKVPSTLSKLLHMQVLSIARNSITGVVPTILTTLTGLNKLNISFNSFAGRIPSTLNYNTKLVMLDLSGNSLTGPLPPNIGYMSMLTYLGLNENMLSGTLPSFLGLLCGLSELNLSYNTFNGSIPSELVYATNITSLDLSGNSLTGALPPSIGDMSTLTYLGLNENMLSGTLPSFLGLLCGLSDLNLSYNSFTGSIPSELAYATNMITLDLSGNSLTSMSTFVKVSYNLQLLTTLRIASNAILGTIPPEISRIASLTRIELQSNSLGGPLPHTLSSMTALRYLDLSRNRFGLYLPDIFSVTAQPEAKTIVGKVLPTTIAYFNINAQKAVPSKHNKTIITATYGTIPNTILYFSQLSVLSLASNAISGIVPTRLGNLTALNTLNLGNNTVKFDISRFFSVAPKGLVTLNMSYNKIFGKIPKKIKFFKELHMISLASNSIAGILPIHLFYLSKLKTLNLMKNPLNTDMTVLFSLALKSLVMLNLASTKTAGSVSSDISDFTALAHIDLSGNSYTGNLPSTLGSMALLSYIDLSNNRFTSSIPSSLGGLTALVTLVLSNNVLTGFIPSELVDASSLTMLTLGYNKLNGVIPPLGSLISLNKLDLQNNRLSTTIPSSIGNIRNLAILSLNNNAFTGPIPAIIGNMDTLEFIDLKQNSLTGSLPVLNLARLQYLNFADNKLAGAVPSSFENLLGINYIYMQNNSLSGTLPSSLVYAQPLVIRLDNNRIFGTIPSSFSNMSLLSVLLLNNNKLSGDPAPAFSRVYQIDLANIDLSGNAFSAPLPDELFLLPNLKTLAATSNCFYGTLPNAVCNATKLVVLDIAGLRGGRLCSQSLNFVYVQPKVYKTMSGSIPTCIWSLSSLTSLQISGNGLTGKLVAPSNSSMLSIARLRSNKISGTAPEAFQSFPFTALDLSFNKIQGLWNRIASNFNQSSSELGLAVNRLSGYLPSGVKNAKNVNVLSGNVFGCDLKRLPDNDPNRKSYVCGSQGYDYAAYAFAGVVWFEVMAVAVFAAVVLCIASRQRKQFTEGYFHGDSKEVLGVVYAQLRTWFNVVGTNVLTNTLHVHRQLTKYHVPGRDEPVRRDLKEVQGFVDVLRLYRKCAAVIIVVIMFVCLPLYPCLKLYINNGDYRMVLNEYNWSMTAVFLSGLGPGLLLFFLWNCLMYTHTFMISIETVFETIEHKEKRQLTYTQRGMRLVEYLVTFLVVILDVVAVLALNAGFVFVMLSDYSPDIKSATQLGKSVMDAVLEAVLLMLLKGALAVNNENEDDIDEISHDQKRFMYWRVFMMIFNSVGAPLVIIVCLSDACFKDFFSPPPPVATSYYFEGCVPSSYYYDPEEGLVCGQPHGLLGPVINTFIPSFTYNNTCSASLFTQYIPAVIYGYISGLVMPWFLTIFPAGLKKASIPSLLVGIFPPFVWPAEGAEQDGDESLIPAGDIMATFVKDFAILLTFGFISPPLALAVFFVILFRSLYLQLLIGRFTESSRKHAEVMNRACTATHFAPMYTSYILIVSTGLFQSLIIFDMLSDKYGIMQAFGPSVALMGVTNLVRLLIPFLVRRFCKPEVEDEVDQAAREVVMDPMEVGMTEQKQLRKTVYGVDSWTQTATTAATTTANDWEVRTPMLDHKDSDRGDTEETESDKAEDTLSPPADNACAVS